MRHVKSLLFSLPALLLASSVLSADSIDTLTGAGPVNDGLDYVLPYELTANNVQVDADCYDFFDQIQVGQSWSATALTLEEAAAYGQFSNTSNALTGYEEVAWLSSQPTSTPHDQIDLQMQSGTFSSLQPLHCRPACS